MSPKLRELGRRHPERAPGGIAGADTDDHTAALLPDLIIQLP